MQEKKANHLIHENSPYLLQHAYNPVEWFAWGDDAFNKAKNEDKPILVSIGYAACHWCHVMEHESFENEETAKFMNTWFVNIKIDREERPDIDNIYMNACQILTGAGGWPLNIFLTPNLLPFSGGTYFPPKPGYGKPSWMEVLMYMKDVFTNSRDKVEQQAATLSDHILKMDNAFVSQLTELPLPANVFSQDEIESAINGLQNNFDTIDGGFGSAPKFPGSMSLLFLCRTLFYMPNATIEKQLHLSLNKMLEGGIYDQIGGGFARYTVDKKWIIPHFEKMLYDNALLITVYAETYRAKKQKQYLQIIIETIDFLERELMSPEFGFYASYDADSEGVEGKYYTFSIEEINQIFIEDNAFVCRLYNIEQNGNWEHTNILFRTTNNEALASEFNLSLVDVEIKISAIKKRLLQYREKRIKPALDDKIILSWNALTCSAYVQAFKATNLLRYKTMAISNLNFLIAKFSDSEHPNQLFHTYKNNIAKHPAFIEDYAAYIQALLDVYEITSDIQYLEIAISCNKYVNAHFGDSDGLFFFTNKNQKDIPIRNKDFYDNATPSGNSIMLQNLIRLHIFTGNNELYQQSVRMISSLKVSMIKHGSSFGNWLTAALQFVYPIAEVVIMGKEAHEMADKVMQMYYPHLLMQFSKKENTDYPLLMGRYSEKATFIYLCKNNVCNLPVNSAEDLAEALKEF